MFGLFNASVANICLNLESFQEREVEEVSGLFFVGKINNLIIALNRKNTRY